MMTPGVWTGAIQEKRDASFLELAIITLACHTGSIIAFALENGSIGMCSSWKFIEVQTGGQAMRD